MARFLLLAALAMAAPAVGQEVPFLGIQMDSNHIGEGVRVEQVIEGSAAERTGFAAGDVILDLDGHPVREFSSLAEWIRSHPIGSAIVVTIEREGRSLVVVPVLGNREGPGVVPTPLPDPLAASFERLAWKAEDRYLRGEYGPLPSLVEAAEKAAELHLAAAVAALPGAARAQFEARLGGHRERLEWFARQGRREAKAPLCVVDPPSEDEVVERSREVADLAGRLDDPDYAVRESATRRLLELGSEVREDLEALLARSSLEAQHRIQEVLDQMDAPLDDADRPRQVRWPVEAELVEFAGGRGRLAARFGTIRGPRFLQAAVVREEKAIGRIEFEADGDGALELREGQAIAPASGDYLVWIDVAREAD